jgi:hypothetical protein
MLPVPLCRRITCALGERHGAQQVGTACVPTPAWPLCRSMMRPKVFYGTESIIFANSVLPTFMRLSGPFKFANGHNAIQILDTHES